MATAFRIRAIVEHRPIIAIVAPSTWRPRLVTRRSRHPYKTQHSKRFDVAAGTDMFSMRAVATDPSFMAEG